MTAADWIAAMFLLLGLIVLAGIAIRAAYLRAHPKPRAPLTRWQDGRIP